METRIAKKVDTHISAFKDDIKQWFTANKCTIIGESDSNEFLQFIYDYNALALSKEDFQEENELKILYQLILDVVRKAQVVINALDVKKKMKIIVGHILKARHMECHL